MAVTRMSRPLVCADGTYVRNASNGDGVALLTSDALPNGLESSGRYYFTLKLTDVADSAGAVTAVLDFGLAHRSECQRWRPQRNGQTREPVV